MSFNFILSGLFEEDEPEQNLDFEPDCFESEIQELAERLGKVLARHHVFEGKASCYSDFTLRPDINAYKRAYKEETEVYWGSDKEF